MEKKYSDAFKAGFQVGIAIAIIYGIIALVGIGINHTQAMVSYMDQLTQYNKDMMNQSYYSYGVPYTYSHPMPRPPLEYYIVTILSFIMYGLLVLGFILAGIYAMRQSGQPKYSLKDTAYMGTLSAIGSLVPLIIVMILMNIVNVLVNGSTLFAAFDTFSSVYGNMPASFSALVPAIIACELVCCCLPIGILVPVILSCIGALGYVLVTGKLERGVKQA